MRPFRILVVEDFELFRRVICSILRRRPEFQVIHEAADGLEAVRLAEKLQPDLILIDIGLPRLNGLEATRLIRKLTPHAKILFLSQESSSDIVQQCLRLGGLGYVQKVRTENDLLPAVDSVLRGIQFVSSGLEFKARADAQAPYRHEVLFSSNDAAILEGLTRFVASVLSVGNAAITLVNESRRVSLLRRLHAQGVDIHGAMQRGTCRLLDAAGAPNPIRVLEAVRASSEAAARAGKSHPRVAVCCERAGRLWAEGKTEEAIQVEQHCNDLAKTHAVDILCAYPSPQRPQDAEGFWRISSEHTAVYAQ